jgi:hypothetical protein
MEQLDQKSQQQLLQQSSKSEQTVQTETNNKKAAEESTELQNENLLHSTSTKVLAFHLLFIYIEQLIIHETSIFS